LALVSLLLGACLSEAPIGSGAPLPDAGEASPCEQMAGELLGTACSTGLDGACSAGTLECVGELLQCMPEAIQDTEICDGVDNDCDGLVDEELGWQPFDEGMSGGSVAAVYFDPRQTDVAYALLGQRLYRSLDGGDSFGLRAKAERGLVQLAFPSESPELLLAASDGGLLRSEDGGQSWTTAAASGVPLSSVLIHPADELRLFLGTRSAGILRSTNGGQSFDWVNAGVPFSWISSLDGDPRDPRVVLASLYLLDEDGGWSREGGILKSVDGGDNWDLMHNGVGTIDRIARCHDDADLLYADAVEWQHQGEHYPGGLLRSDDGGESWDIVALDGTDLTDIALGQSSCDTVFGTVWTEGLYRSTDGGQSFEGPLDDGMQVQHPGAMRLAVAPGSDAQLLAANHAGVFLSEDAGDGWARAGGLAAANVTSLSTADPERLWLATSGQGLWTRPSTSQPWTRLSTEALAADWIMAVAPDPADSQRILVGDWGSLWRSTDGGESFAAVSEAVNAQSIAYHPENSATVFAGTQLAGVLKSIDGGQSWAPSNAGLPDPWNTGPCVCIDVRAVLVDAASPQTLYAATHGKGLHRSTDGGASWEQHGPELVDQSIRCLVQMPDEPDTLLACVDGDGIWRSSDAGQSFARASDGLTSLGVTGLVVDEQSGALYATTDDGVFQSADGTEWQSLQGLCLPTPQVRSPALWHQGDQSHLVVGTWGSGLLALPL